MKHAGCQAKPAPCGLGFGIKPGWRPGSLSKKRKRLNPGPQKAVSTSARLLVAPVSLCVVLFRRNLLYGARLNDYDHLVGLEFVAGKRAMADAPMGAFVGPVFSFCQSGRQTDPVWSRCFRVTCVSDR